jgi:hypothetical protein
MSSWPGTPAPIDSATSSARPGSRPYGTGRGYRNFPDVRGGVDHDGANAPRLTRVRRRHDPDRLT